MNSIKATHVDCNIFLSIYIIQVYKIIFPNPSHFMLSLCQPPISILYSAATLQLSYFHITHLLPKQFPIFHSHPHSSSFQTVHLLYFALIYTPFNLSFLFYVRLHTSLFFTSSSLAANTFFQAVSFLLTAAFTSSFHSLYSSTTHLLSSSSLLFYF